MGLDRFVRWQEPRPEWGDPTIEQLATVAQDFLGPRWEVTTKDVWIICQCSDRQTFSLRSVRDDLITDGRTWGEMMQEELNKQTRGFEVFHDLTHPDGHTSVITRQADEFTGALADRYADIIARWWHGIVECG